MLLDTELAAIGVESYIRNWAAINHANSQTVECCCLAARIGVTQPNHKTALADRPTDHPMHVSSGLPAARRHMFPRPRFIGRHCVCKTRARARCCSLSPQSDKKSARARTFFTDLCRRCHRAARKSNSAIILHTHTLTTIDVSARHRVSHRVHRGESHAHSHRTPAANEIPARGGAPFRTTQQRRQTRNRWDFCVLLF